MKNKIIIAKIALIAAALPAAMFAYETGPDPRRTGAPGDAGTCLGSGCHSGSALNGGPGSVKIVLPNGNSYSPGVKQRIQVQITDSTRQKFGFEFTARLASDLANGVAGTFTPADDKTQVICDDGSGAPCGAKFPMQFIEHNLAGYAASTAGGYTYQFDWTPPASNVGDIRFYVAANAGPGGSPVQTNANVYTTSVTLSAAAATTGGPTPDPGGIVPVYSSSTTISPGTWVSIYSTVAKNLSAGTSTWNGDFPVSLGGVDVKINGKQAYLWFVAPTQINLQVPDDTATGSVPVVITNAGVSTTTTVTMGTASPSFLLLADGKHGTGFVYSADGTQTLLGPAGSAGGARPAKPGEVVAIYGVGFGPTNPAVPAGKVFTSAANLVTKPVITVGGTPVTVDFGGVVGAGLYQFNFKIPANAASGDQPVVATVAGLQTQSNVFLPIQ